MEIFHLIEKILTSLEDKKQENYIFMEATMDKTSMISIK
jgi:hypothetical protein